MENKNEKEEKNENMKIPEKYKGFLMQMAKTKTMKKSFKNLKIKYNQTEGLGLYSKE